MHVQNKFLHFFVCLKINNNKLVSYLFHGIQGQRCKVFKIFCVYILGGGGGGDAICMDPSLLTAEDIHLSQELVYSNSFVQLESDSSPFMKYVLPLEIRALALAPSSK